MLESQVNQLIHRSINRHDLQPEFSITVFDGRREDTACFSKCLLPGLRTKQETIQTNTAWTFEKITPGRSNLTDISEVARLLDTGLTLGEKRISNHPDTLIVGIDSSTWSAQLKAAMMELNISSEDLRLKCQVRIGKQFFLGRSDGNFQPILPLFRLETMNGQKFFMQFTGSGHSELQMQSLRRYLSRHGFELLLSKFNTTSVHLVEINTKKKLAVKLLQEESTQDDERLTALFAKLFKSRSFYEVLGVDKKADSKTILREFRRLSLQVRLWL